MSSINFLSHTEAVHHDDDDVLNSSCRMKIVSFKVSQLYESNLEPSSANKFWHFYKDDYRLEYRTRHST